MTNRIPSYRLGNCLTDNLSTVFIFDVGLDVGLSTVAIKPHTSPPTYLSNQSVYIESGSIWMDSTELDRAYHTYLCHQRDIERFSYSVLCVLFHFVSSCWPPRALTPLLSPCFELVDSFD